MNFFYFCRMSRKIIAYENYYKDFFDTLDKRYARKSPIWITLIEDSK